MKKMILLFVLLTVEQSFAMGGIGDLTGFKLVKKSKPQKLAKKEEIKRPDRRRIASQVKIKKAKVQDIWNIKTEPIGFWN